MKEKSWLILVYVCIMSVFAGLFIYGQLATSRSIKKQLDKHKGYEIGIFYKEMDRSQPDYGHVYKVDRVSKNEVCMRQFMGGRLSVENLTDDSDLVAIKLANKAAYDNR